MAAPLVTHAHHHCHVLVKTGGADAVFDVRGRPCPLAAGQAVCVNAWEPHAYLHQRHSTLPTEILALYIEPQWLEDAGLAGTAAGATRLFSRPSAALSPKSVRLAQELTALLREAASGTGARFEALLIDLMISIIEPLLPACRPQRYFRQIATRVPLDARIRRAMAILRENVGTDMDMGAVAARCGLSRAHFFELFHRATRVTPAIYANELRMEAAFEQLARAAHPIGAVADRLGFSAPGHFTRFFRAHIGITPRAYRLATRERQSACGPLAGS
jgi:AraC-like DNA-binding protein